MKPWMPVSLIALTLTGCGARPGATLASYPLQAPLAVTYGSTLTKPQVGVEEAARGSVGIAATVGKSAAETKKTESAGAAGGADPRPSADQPAAADDAPDVVMPGEETAVATAEKDPGAKTAEDGPVKGASTLDRTDANGRAYAAASIAYDPVYLTPRQFPILMPGQPTSLPSYSPHVVDGARIPTDAFEELARLGRLRERKAHFMRWLFGYGFPKIDAPTAHARLAAQETIYLGPDGSRLHFASTYKPVTSAATLDAMLPDLQRDALTAAGQAAREADIADRMALLPAFNQTYDITRLVLLDAIIGGYDYQGQPIRRGVTTAANLFEFASVKRAAATYWEDHPGSSAADIRRAAHQALLAKFRAIGAEAASLAEMPTAYTDAQAIPGLRAPRAIQGSERWAHDEDVNYNLEAIRTLVANTPSLLAGSLYP